MYIISYTLGNYQVSLHFQIKLVRWFLIIILSIRRKAQKVWYIGIIHYVCEKKYLRSASILHLQKRKRETVFKVMFLSTSVEQAG